MILIPEACLSRLTDRQREVYQMMQTDGATFESVSEKLNISVPTVRNHYRHAELRIRAYEKAVLQEQYDREKIYNLEISREKLKVVKTALEILQSYSGKKQLDHELRIRSSLKGFASAALILETSEILSNQIEYLLLDDNA